VLNLGIEGIFATGAMAGWPFGWARVYGVDWLSLH